MLTVLYSLSSLPCFLWPFLSIPRAPWVHLWLLTSPIPVPPFLRSLCCSQMTSLYSLYLTHVLWSQEGQHIKPIMLNCNSVDALPWVFKNLEKIFCMKVDVGNLRSWNIWILKHPWRLGTAQAGETLLNKPLGRTPEMKGFLLLGVFQQSIWFSLGAVSGGGLGGGERQRNTGSFEAFSTQISKACGNSWRYKWSPATGGPSFT